MVLVGIHVVSTRSFHASSCLVQMEVVNDHSNGFVMEAMSDAQIVVSMKNMIVDLMRVVGVTGDADLEVLFEKLKAVKQRCWYDSFVSAS
jgi:hypothetical protein